MSVLKTIIGALSFNETGGGLGGILRKLYFGTAYNTTFPVNAMLALGSVSPYLLFEVARGQLSEADYLSAIAITLISAYFYNLLYIVNDIIDRRKDERLGIPKLTARHILGPSYLLQLAAAYLVVLTVVGLLWNSLLIPLLAYGAGLMGLSVLHSHAGRGKYVTVFIERFAKFCSPFGLLWLASGSTDIGLMLAGAMIVYPLGFTLDYAYRGYIHDRLKLSERIRLVPYAIYWSLVGIILAFEHPPVSNLERIEDIAIYVALYFATVGLTGWLAKVLPFGFLEGHYTPKEVWEKRRLLTYGILQLLILMTGAVYVAVR